MPSVGSVSNMSTLKMTLGKTLGLLERLGLANGLGMLWRPLDELEKVAREVWLRCFSSMLPRPTILKKEGWMVHTVY